MGQELTAGVRNLTAQEMRELAVAKAVNIPIEQTWVWYEFENSFPDRELIGFFAFVDSGVEVALITLMKTKYHGFDFVWAKHGPVWLVEPTAHLEHRLVDTMVAKVKKSAPRTAFLRMHLLFPREDYREPAQIVTHDRTVFVDLTGTRDDVFARFKKRTRADVRRHRRRNPVEVSDETEAGLENFSEYYKLLEATAERQGFTAWDEDVYTNLLRALGEEHVRLYCARRGGEVLAWALFTLSGTEVAYYYAASSDEGREAGAPAQILAFAAEEFSEEDFLSMDLMGIGSDLAPTLNSLTPFKTGFSEEISEVAPAYDIPVNKVLYGLMVALRTGKGRAKEILSKVKDRSAAE